VIIYLRYATDSQTRKLPPFVDSTDGDSEETGLTIANTDILIGKPGATTLTAKHSGGATHISNGIYYATFDSSDSDTIGNGELYIHKSGALFNFATLIILPQKEFDALFGNGIREANVIQLLGTAWLTPAVAGTPDVNAKTVTDKTGFSLATSPPTAADIKTAIEGSEVLAMAADLPGEAPTAEAIRAEIDDHSTQLAAIAESGSSPVGSVDWTYTVTDSVSHNPISGATVEAYSDAACTNLVRSAISDSSGIATFRLIPATYYILVLADGYDVPDADMEVVS
jgi:hypothetical protein